MAKIEVRCQECGHEARVPEAFAGKKVRCLRCRAKLRVPGNESAPSGAVVGLDSTSRSARGASSKGTPARAPSGNLPSKLRREVQLSIREILGDYEHAIEDSPRGFEVDLRGVAFGLARTLVEDLLAVAGVRDVKLAGGTGECRLTITLEGAAYDPDDSFADESDETQLFQRPTAAELGTPVDEGSRRPSKAPRDAVPPPFPSASRTTRDGSRPKPPEPPAQAPGSGDRRELERLVEEGRNLLDAGEAGAAIEVLEKACRIERDNPAAVEALGQAYSRAGDHERARRAYRHLTKLVPDDADAAVAYAAEAFACSRLDDAKEAIATVIRLDPENPKGYKYASVLYERLGDLEKSRKFRSKYEALKGR